MLCPVHRQIKGFPLSSTVKAMNPKPKLWSPKNQSVRCREAARELELAVGVLVIEGMHLPAELVHRGDNVVEKFQIEQGEARVVGSFGNGVPRIVRRDAVMRRWIAPDDIGLTFDAEVEFQAQLGSALHLIRQNRA